MSPAESFRAVPPAHPSGRAECAPRAVQAVAGYIPGIDPGALSWETLAFEAHGQRVQVALPRLTPAQLETVAAGVSAAAQEHLAALPVLDIVDAIDRAIARMLDASDPQRQEAEQLLAVVTGFDPEMLRLGLNASLKAFRRPQLLRMLAEDFGDPGLLDGFRPRAKGGWSRAYGPALLAHVWAGNVPGLPLWSMVAGLLVKAGSVGKVSSDEPLFAGWFARVLAEVEPRLAGVFAVVWWRGGETELEQALCRQADVLTVYGGVAALDAWQRQVPAGARLLAHGHKLSAGLVSASALDARQSQLTARLAARDMMQWDQQGCYSPQVFYVERGAQVSPREFAYQLAGELAALQRQFARRSLSLEEIHSVASWRQALELQGLRDGNVELLGPADAPWCVAYIDMPQAPSPGALNRTACVLAVDSLEQAARWLGGQRVHLQTVGLAASPEELFRLAPALGRAGATRICALGSMATPEAGWHHDGRFSLLDLVRMVDIETSAEQAAEALALYRD
ncbi:acyl-CoA reductase [Pollutimonas bauzanensis]|uniref:Acyl-CoA reductase (LuxC) n=1 Tax=Pollutimonas bauzanensis TaxID=658167 RepID=A0A1M5M137_9BURK|nr:acyl-CoA reductase [Pollutimonas bauzanensis]SHG71017.1 Acyl-CoA reductase (LuxC) [Pollutimonas bauzanensis]